MKNDEFMKEAFSSLQDTPTLTEQQKKNMMNLILAECDHTEVSRFSKIKQLFITYPWRSAFILSTAQTLIFTLLFGTRYTNLFLSYFGG